MLAKLQTTDVDLDAATAVLEREGVASFSDSYQQLLDCIQNRGHISQTGLEAHVEDLDSRYEVQIVTDHPALAFSVLEREAVRVRQDGGEGLSR